MSLHYRVLPVDPAAHLVQVDLELARPAADQLLRLPAWVPGSYTIRELARHIRSVEAHDARGPLTLERVDKDTWRAPGAQGPLTVRLVTYCWELSVRTCHVDLQHAFLSPPSLFLEAIGHEGPITLDVLPPPDPRCAAWRLATSLPRVAGEPWGFGAFQVADYDDLLDHPMELGTFEVRSFQAGGVPHHLAVTGAHDGDLDRVVADLAPICEAHIAMFGGRPPMADYLFLLTVVGDGYGGLEHRSSTALIARRDDLPRAGDEAVSEAYRGLLGLCSHEYFHLWNVKRIKPQRFTPYDLRRETHTTLLWAFEGITSYYDDLGLLRSGRVDARSWLELVGRTATRVWRAPGRHIQSLADSSFDAWTKLYKPDENSLNAGISYYTQGALLAMLLDLHLRLHTDGRCSLDDVMRALWADHDGGIPEDGVERVAERVSGLDLRAFFDRHVRGAGELPLADALPAFGLRLLTRPQDGATDLGGKPLPDDRLRTLRGQGSLGASLSNGGGAKIDRVDTGSPAMAAGLAAGDVIIAVDGWKVDAAGVAARLARRAPGDVVRVTAFRRDELLSVDVTLTAPAENTVWLAWDDEAAPEVAARRAAWLGT